MDLQAQDRAHRIGQTRPVLIFRLVSAHTIETKILQKAGNKRKLEALIISQGKFGRLVDENGKVILGRSKQPESMAGMAKALLDLEGEEINVASAGDQIISDGDLEVLLDRSPEAYAREKGWSAGLGKGGERAEQIKKGERTAFEVSPCLSFLLHPCFRPTTYDMHCDLPIRITQQTRSKLTTGIRILERRSLRWTRYIIWRRRREG
jgi:ATP-dependent DNA helicase